MKIMIDSIDSADFTVLKCAINFPSRFVLESNIGPEQAGSDGPAVSLCEVE